MRIVLDSNVIVAAFATRGLCAALFEHCLEHHEVYLCNAMLREITGALRKRIKVPRTIINEVELYLRDNTSLATPAPVSAKVCRDRKDLPVLGCALSSASEYLVTGDDDLLSLRRFEGTEIVTPRQFWEKVKTDMKGGNRFVRPGGGSPRG